MDILLNFGFLPVDLDTIISTELDVVKLSDDEVSEKIDALRSVGCNDRQIRNIFTVNPSCLFMPTQEIYRMLSLLKSLDVECIDSLLDVNPNILSYDVSDIRDFVNDSEYDGVDDAIAALIDNPYIIEEV